MTFSTAHNSAKAADPAKLLLLNNCQIKHNHCCGVSLGPQHTTWSITRHPTNPNVTIQITHKSNYFFLGHVPLLHQILRISVE